MEPQFKLAGDIAHWTNTHLVCVRFSPQNQGENVGGCKNSGERDSRLRSDEMQLSKGRTFQEKTLR